MNKNMPGFFITNINSDNNYHAKNLYEKKCIYNKMSVENYTIIRNVLDSFANDKLFDDSSRMTIVTDGVLYNAKSLISLYNEDNLFNTLIDIYLEKDVFFNKLEGPYSGAIYDKEKDEWLIFTNITGDRSIFYYYDDCTRKFIIGSQLNYVTDFMSQVGLDKKYDEHGISCLLDFGYFIDESTGINNVKRLYPGDYLVINKNGISINNYYIADNDAISCSIDEAIENLDQAFNHSLIRIAEKNKEYGYKNLVDLSGGLDSRMICYALKRLGYENSLLITYAQNDSNEVDIAKKISNSLNFDWYFKSLDNGKCLKYIDEIIQMNSGTAFYSGITGGKDFLEILDNRIIGMEFTGLLGDMHDSSMTVSSGLDKPNIDNVKYRTSTMFKMNKNTYSNVVSRFKNHELYWLYTRGMMAGMSTCLTRQNFVEPVTPFGDKEFLDAYLSIPWEMRVNKKVLMLWLIRKYPEAGNIKYAATGMSIKNEDGFVNNNIRRVKYYSHKFFSDLMGKPVKNNMNPMDYWLLKDNKLKRFLDNYYYSNRNIIEEYEDVYFKVCSMYENGHTFNDKSLALTVIAYFRNYLFK